MRTWLYIFMKMILGDFSQEQSIPRIIIKRTRQFFGDLSDFKKLDTPEYQVYFSIYTFMHVGLVIPFWLACSAPLITHLWSQLISPMEYEQGMWEPSMALVGCYISILGMYTSYNKHRKYREGTLGDDRKAGDIMVIRWIAMLTLFGFLATVIPKWFVLPDSLIYTVVSVSGVFLGGEGWETYLRHPKPVKTSEPAEDSPKPNPEPDSAPDKPK